jgi:hypothetical protein
MGSATEMSAGTFARKVVCTFVSLALLIACLTILWLCMRAVMDIGGSCGSSNTYEIATPCPEGIGWLMPVSIWAGLFALGFYIGNRSGLPGPEWAVLAWPALFLSLGFNFWEYGLDAPGPQGMEWGMIICGVIFVLMGAVPLFAVLGSPTARRELLWSDPSPVEKRPSVAETAKQAAKKAKPNRPKRSSKGGPSQGSSAPVGAAAPRSTPGAGGGVIVAPVAAGGGVDVGVDDGVADISGTDDDLAEDLERLATLFRDGQLTVEEYADAKRRRLGKG